MLDLICDKLEDSEVPSDVMKELLFGLANLATLHKKFRVRMIDNPKLLKYLKNKILSPFEDSSIRVECGWVLINLFSFK